LRFSLPDSATPLLERLPARFRQRGVALVLALVIEALLVLAILTLGIAPDRPKPNLGPRLATFTVEGPKAESEPAPDQAKDRPALAEAQLQPQQASPSAPSTTPQPAQPAPNPPPLIPIPSNQAAGFRISNLPRQPAAPGPKKAMMGPAFTPLAGDSKRIGTAPGGQPLYAAEWYREPDDSELAGYLSTADGPGYALIACRTVSDWRVEDCVALDEYPSGSNIARSVLAAAWHFRVRPPRLGGVYKVGEWVRIRITYGIRRSG
jgi:protein TonB